MSNEVATKSWAAAAAEWRVQQPPTTSFHKPLCSIRYTVFSFVSERERKREQVLEVRASWKLAMFMYAQRIELQPTLQAKVGH